MRTDSSGRCLMHVCFDIAIDLVMSTMTYLSAFVEARIAELTLIKLPLRSGIRYTVLQFAYGTLITSCGTAMFQRYRGSPIYGASVREIEKDRGVLGSPK
ncbi:hypothetical protein BDV97DRAFT_361146 [Delphinella strobiligena]|nr:hypothetical protein BDV97DRAFT_361146 [Delphinella strobiligena]